MRAIIFIDLDGTLWDHKDASALKPPLSLVDRSCLADSSGQILCLYKDVRYFLSTISRYDDTIVCTLSWNIYSIAREALEKLGIAKYFDYLFISYTPYKELLLKTALDIISITMDTNAFKKTTIYIDDRDIHVNRMKNIVGNMVFIHMWHTVKGFRELVNKVEEIISKRQE